MIRSTGFFTRPGTMRRAVIGFIVLLVLTFSACKNALAADLLACNFSTDPRQQGWVCSDWNLAVLSDIGWSTNGYISVDPGFTPFWVSPQFTVPALEYYRITAVSRGAVGLCGVGYNQVTTWGRYPATNYQGLLVADDWTVTPEQTDWQTNVYCS